MSTRKKLAYIGRNLRKIVILHSKGCSWCGKSIAYHTGDAMTGNRGWRAYAKDGTPFHFDHIVPISKGGVSTPDNIQLLCQECNLLKGNKTDGTEQARG